MNDIQTLVAIVTGTLTSFGLVVGVLAAVVRFTVYRPLAEKIDRGNRLLARHTHDEDGEVVAPIVNGARR